MLATPLTTKPGGRPPNKTGNNLPKRRGKQKPRKRIALYAKSVLSGMLLTGDDATKVIYQKAFTQISESNNSEAIQNLVDDMVVKGNQYKSFNFDKVVINLMRTMVKDQKVKNTPNRIRNTTIVKEAMAKLL